MFSVSRRSRRARVVARAFQRLRRRIHPLDRLLLQDAPRLSVPDSVLRRVAALRGVLRLSSRAVGAIRIGASGHAECSRALGSERWVFRRHHCGHRRIRGLPHLAFVSARTTAIQRRRASTAGAFVHSRHRHFHPDTVLLLQHHASSTRQ